MRPNSRSYFLALAIAVASASASAQSISASADRVIRMSGVVPVAAGAPSGAPTAVEFSIFDQESGGVLLWQETQVLPLDGQGGYSVLLGATSADGLPADLFAGGAARWLTVNRTGTAPGQRTLLTAVPYAMSAVNADTLGGRPATDFMLVPSARSTAAGAGADAAAADDANRDPRPLVNNGTTGFIGKFFNTVDLDNSLLFQSGSNVGVGTTTPLDALHTRFLNTAGTATGYAVQNLGNTANSYSGMLFYDHTGALRQFQGYNNGTGEYRINNISPSASINFMTGSTSRFFVGTTGNVGIGNSSPENALHIGNGGNPILKIDGAVNSNGNGARLRWTEVFGTDYGIEAIHDSGDDKLIFRAIEANAVSVDNILVLDRLSGNVGIGIANSVRARLEVAEGGTYDYGTRGVLNINGASQLTTTGTSTTNSIFADGFIWSQATFALSDARIKNIKGRSNGASDLATLMDVKITDYAYIDTVAKGDGMQKKVIAQELEEVFPQAVRRGRDVVPDIYAMGTMSDGWVAMTTTLKQGERVRLHHGDDVAVYDVLEVDKGRFRTSLAAADGTKVFVYGRVVDDFRAVDYEAVSMLNVSATQELYRKVQQQETETAALRQELAELRTALATALDALNAAKNRQ